MNPKNNLSRNENHYWDNGAYCVNCGILKGNVINNNIHPIWHPRCNPGCDSVWHDQEPLEYEEESDQDRFYRELEEEAQSDREQDRLQQERSIQEWEETDEERFLRELEEEEQEDWEQSQKEWEEERLQEEWEEERAEIWELEREEMDHTIAQEHHARCCLEILARHVEY